MKHKTHNNTFCGRKWNIIGSEIKVHTIAILPTRIIYSITLCTELRIDASVSTLVETVIESAVALHSVFGMSIITNEFRAQDCQTCVTYIIPLSENDPSVFWF